MVIDGVMCLIKYQKADISAQVDVSMAECIKEHLRGRDHDAMFFKDPFPESGVFPLVRLKGARN